MYEISKGESRVLNPCLLPNHSLDFSHLQISVNHEVRVEVLVVLTEWVEESLGDFEPAHVEQELQRGKYGKVVVVAVGLKIQQLKSCG